MCIRDRISRWKVAELQAATATLAFSDNTGQATRLAAVRTLGDLGADETKRLAKLVGSDAPSGLRIAGLESLDRLNLPEAAALGAGMIGNGQARSMKCCRHSSIAKPAATP